MKLDVDMRASLPPVRDQGTRGTCLAFAATGAHEFGRLLTQGHGLDLCEEVVYWKGRALSGLPSGMTFQAAKQALFQVGQPDEDLWPYDPFLDDTLPEYAPPVSAVEPAACFCATLEPIQKSAESARLTLSAGIAVIAGVKMSMPFFTAAGGIVAMPTPQELIPQGHAILLVGHTGPGDGYLLFRNSWGGQWGDSGYGYLPYAYFDTYCTGSFVLYPH